MRTFIQKSIAIGVLGLLLLIALSMIEGVVTERQARQASVEANIAETAAGSQTITGPVLVVPYTERVTEVEPEANGKSRTVTRQIARQAVFMPESLDTQGRVDVSPRQRGLYQALLYTFTGRATARFRVPAHLVADAAARDITAGRAYLVLGVSDVRGLQSPPVVQWDGTPLSPEQGTGLASLPSGVHADIGPLSFEQTREYGVTVSLDVLGMNSLSVTPVGKATTVSLDSAWPHPSSIGRFLPRAKGAADPYFPAKWSVSHLSTNAGTALLAAPAPNAPPPDTFGVAFIEPVNVYLQSERAMKYGVLFIGLTFAAFLLFELLKSLRIHALQYGFVGLALTVFFLLLISLSEHLPFGAAYAIAAVACVSLVTYYIAHVLRGWGRALAFGAQLAALYGALFGLLRSEDNALVLGSVLLFGILAAVMIVTRKVDWYSLTTRPGNEQPVSD
ncbi:MAG: cell envelope integrity protein CreD [Burkholderiales bacterium]